MHLLMLNYLRIPVNFTMHCIIPINPLSLLYFKNELCKKSSSLGAEEVIRLYILHLIVSVDKKEQRNSNIAGICIGIAEIYCQRLIKDLW